jgi:LasA protease
MTGQPSFPPTESAQSTQARPAPDPAGRGIARSLNARLTGLILLLVTLLACARTPSPTQVPATVSAESDPVPGQTPAATSRTPVPTPTPAPYVHFVEAGETLDYLAARLDCTAEEIIQASGLDNPNALQIGQKLVLPPLDLPAGPSTPLLPDSEFVYGPSHVGFDVEAFCQTRPGYLNSYEELVDGETLTGPQIVELVAQRYSVSPRLLLAMIEFQSGWLDNPNPAGWASDHPLGATEEGQLTLLYQLAWAADRLNEGYYDWKGRGREIILLVDSKRAQYDQHISAGTAAVQYLLAYNATWEEWQTICGDGPESYLATYEGLFGDPFERDRGFSVPPDLVQPDLRLPWESGHTWYLTGGPHGAWNDGSAWAALDFITQEQLGCQTSAEWEVAAAAGLVTRSKDGVVVIDLDGDGHEETGWNLFYMHVAAEDRVPVGTFVDEGQRLGHPSCEGGYSTASHLHFARKYDGEWIPADGSCPLVLSGWRAHASVPYEGTMTRGEEVRTACECREDEVNGLTAE